MTEMASPPTSDSANLPDNLKDRIANSYNAIADTYDQWTEPTHKARLEQLNALLPRLHSRSKPLTILELGCGSGVPVMKTVLNRLVDTKYIANEISSRQIEIARKNLGSEHGHSVTFIEGDMLAIEQADHSLDAVIAMYSIIHLPRTEQTQLMSKIHTWLKSGGLLLANFAAEDVPQEVQQRWLHEKGWMFWSGWGAERTVAQLRDVGFEILMDEVKTDVVTAEFLWVLAEKS